MNRKFFLERSEVKEFKEHVDVAKDSCRNIGADFHNEKDKFKKNQKHEMEHLTACLIQHISQLTACFMQHISQLDLFYQGIIDSPICPSFIKEADFEEQIKQRDKKYHLELSIEMCFHKACVCFDDLAYMLVLHHNIKDKYGKDLSNNNVSIKNKSIKKACSQDFQNHLENYPFLKNYNTGEYYKDRYVSKKYNDLMLECIEHNLIISNPDYKLQSLREEIKLLLDIADIKNKVVKNKVVRQYNFNNLNGWIDYINEVRNASAHGGRYATLLDISGAMIEHYMDELLLMPFDNNNRFLDLFLKNWKNRNSTDKFPSTRSDYDDIVCKMIEIWNANNKDTFNIVFGYSDKGLYKRRASDLANKENTQEDQSECDNAVSEGQKGDGIFKDYVHNFIFTIPSVIIVVAEMAKCVMKEIKGECLEEKDKIKC